MGQNQSGFHYNTENWFSMNNTESWGHVEVSLGESWNEEHKAMFYTYTQ